MHHYIAHIQEDSPLIPAIILLDRKLKEHPLDTRVLEEVKKNLANMYDSNTLGEVDMDTCEGLINLIHEKTKQ